MTHMRTMTCSAVGQQCGQQRTLKRTLHTRTMSWSAVRTESLQLLSACLSSRSMDDDGDDGPQFIGIKFCQEW